MFRRIKNINGMEIAETSIMLALIAIACVGILTVFGSNVREMFYKSHDKVKNYQPFGVSANAQQEPIASVAPQSTVSAGTTVLPPSTTTAPLPTTTLVGGDDGGGCTTNCDNLTKVGQ